MAQFHEPSKPKTIATGHGILCLGLPRTGSLSLCHALRTLGVSTLHATELRTPEQCVAWHRAAWANYPYLREKSLLNRRFRGTAAFTRSDWDELFGKEWRSVTDISSVFAEDLITAYPEAKVMLVERDIDSWADSFNAVTLEGFGGFCNWRWWVLVGLGPWVGEYGHWLLWDICRGWLRSETVDDMRRKLKDKHREHYAMVRRMVPKSQLLEYSLADGWGPLCEFLDQPVPDAPFPRVNERGAVGPFVEAMRREVALRAAGKVLGYATVIAVVVGAISSRHRLQGVLWGL